jgi:hypothetical protein
MVNWSYIKWELRLKLHVKMHMLRKRIEWFIEEPTVELSMYWCGFRDNLLNITGFPAEEVWLCPHCHHPDWFGFKQADWSSDENYPYDYLNCQWCGADFPRLEMKRDNLFERLKRWIRGVRRENTRPPLLVSAPGYVKSEVMRSLKNRG